MDTAFQLAESWHRYQIRKGSKVPYISHLMAVSALVLEHGGSHEQAQAALLHDILEDKYVVHRLQSPDQRARLLDHPEILRAVGGDMVEAAKSSLVGLKRSTNCTPLALATPAMAVV